jgi:hypothetical protein
LRRKEIKINFNPDEFNQSVQVPTLDVVEIGQVYLRSSKLLKEYLAFEEKMTRTFRKVRFSAYYNFITIFLRSS